MARLGWVSHEGHDALQLSDCPDGPLAWLDALAPPEMARRLRVYPSDALAAPEGSLARLQPMPGRWAPARLGVVFVPRFAFVAGVEYTLLVHRGGPTYEGDDFDALTIVRPAPSGPSTTRVVAVYPSGPEVPFNLLKLYVEFSAPMSEGFAATHVRIEDAATAELVPAAFLPMDPELWDPARRRLTVLFDPARIKRGLAPHRESGYPLRAGAPVTVIVDAGFLDAKGVPLGAVFTKRYDVGADVRSRVDPRAWTLDLPESGTAQPLVVGFDRPLDYGLLQHCLWVVDPAGRPVAGAVSLGLGECSWTLTPERPWQLGRHRLVVDAILEDLAGNSVVRVFDRDLADPSHTPIDVRQVTLDVVVI